MSRHFISFEAFIAAAKKYEDFFCQCIECRKVRIADGVKAETRSFLQNCLEEFNEWAPNRSELVSMGIKISHGACKLCVRERLVDLAHIRQVNQGYKPCYGTAVDGHCTEDGSKGRKCQYYNSCVTTRKEESDWKQWTETHPKVQVEAILAEMETAMLTDASTSSEITSNLFN